MTFKEKTSPRAKRYSAIKTRFVVADIILTFISLGVFQVFLARPVSVFSLEVSANFYASCFIFSLSFLSFMYIVSLPVHFASSFTVERRFNLSRQSFLDWSKDEGKSVILSLVLSLICIFFFYACVRNFQDTWWLICAFGWIFFSVILARFFPVFIIPLFYKYLPLEEDELKKEIIALAEENDINLEDVCRIDFSRKTSKANATLVGIGKTRKVILADTLTDNFTRQEVLAVVAHEFGHFKYRHIWKLLLFSAVSTIIGFYILFISAGIMVEVSGSRSLSDMYIFPSILLLITVFGIVLMPLQNLYSRVLEKESDSFALRVTANRESFISVMDKLGEMNLADRNPSKMKKIFLYNHPPIDERIRMAEEFKFGESR